MNFRQRRLCGLHYGSRPAPGANEQVMAALDDMLQETAPPDPVTVIMLASKCVGERIDRGVSNDVERGMAEHLNKITRAFWQRSALHGLANEREYPLYLRNYRIFIVYGQPTEARLPDAADN
jgi:conjugal transfer ATP-binding protein TraC